MVLPAALCTCRGLSHRSRTKSLPSMQKLFTKLDTCEAMAGLEPLDFLICEQDMPTLGVMGTHHLVQFDIGLQPVVTARVEVISIHLHADVPLVLQFLPSACDGMLMSATEVRALQELKAPAHFAAPLSSRDSEGPNARHHVYHSLAPAERVCQALVLLLEAAVPIHLPIVQAKARAVLLHLRHQIRLARQHLHLEHSVLVLYGAHLKHNNMITRLGMSHFHDHGFPMQQKHSRETAHAGQDALRTPRTSCLVDNCPQGAVLVQQDLPNDVLVGQQLIAQVDMRDVAHALIGGGHLAPLRQQPLRAIYSMHERHAVDNW